MCVVQAVRYSRWFSPLVSGYGGFGGGGGAGLPGGKGGPGSKPGYPIGTGRELENTYTNIWENMFKSTLLHKFI